MRDFGCVDKNLNGRWKKKENTLGTRIKILKFIFVWDENPLIMIINKLSSTVFLNAFLMCFCDPTSYHMI